MAAFQAELDYIHKALRRHGISASDADDLAQEVFLIMWRRWVDYDPARPLRPWLAGIAFRVAYNHRDRIAREVPGGLVDTRDQAAGPEDQIAAGRLRALVLQALSQVPEKQRTAMILHHLDGLGVREVARATKVPLFTAYSRLRAGRRAFAAAVRRLNTIAGAGTRVHARPETLLEVDDAAIRLSEQSRAKTLSRLRAVLLAPGFASPPRPRGSAAARPVAPVSRPVAPVSAPVASLPRPVLPWIAGAGFVAAAGLLGLLVREHLVEVPGVAVAGPGSPLPTLMLRPGRSASRPQATLASSAGALPPLKVMPAFAPGPSPTHLAEGIVAYWRFDEGRGTPAVVDVSGSTNDCQLQRIDGRRDRISGPHGGALEFNGRAWLECPGVDPLATGGDEMTIAVWIRRRGPPEKVRAIVSRQQGWGARDSFFLGFTASKLMLSSDLWRIRLATEFPLDRWVHVAATRDRDRVARLYLDGVEVARKRSRPPIALPSGSGGENALLIGAARNGLGATSERLRGALDELVIYDRALPAQEVAALAAGVQPALSP